MTRWVARGNIETPEIGPMPANQMQTQWPWNLVPSETWVIADETLLLFVNSKSAVFGSPSLYCSLDTRHKPNLTPTIEVSIIVVSHLYRLFVIIYSQLNGFILVLLSLVPDYLKKKKKKKQLLDIMCVYNEC